MDHKTALYNKIDVAFPCVRTSLPDPAGGLFSTESPTSFSSGCADMNLLIGAD